MRRRELDAKSKEWWRWQRSYGICRAVRQETEAKELTLLADLTAAELLVMLRRIEDRGALNTAHRALGNCGQVFRYAVATGRAQRDP